MPNSCPWQVGDTGKCLYPRSGLPWSCTQTLVRHIRRHSKNRSCTVSHLSAKLEKKLINNHDNHKVLKILSSFLLLLWTYLDGQACSLRLPFLPQKYFCYIAWRHIQNMDSLWVMSCSAPNARWTTTALDNFISTNKIITRSSVPTDTCSSGWCCPTSEDQFARIVTTKARILRHWRFSAL